jgi:RNA polymerase sigma factor (sigma-70 family)
MPTDSSQVNDVDCRRVVRTLIAKYDWALVEEDELVKLVIASVQMGASSAKLEQTAIRHYMVALHGACQQVEDELRCERGYQELHRFLFRVACNRWPDMVEIVTQRALVLVYEQIDRCRSPDTFGAFALNKLRQAYKDELRYRGKELSWQNLDPARTQGGWSTLQSQLADQECFRELVAAIKRLGNKRQQQIILLKFLGGLSDDEIANRLDIEIGNVRVIRHRGLKQLRKDEQLKHYLED